MLAARSAAQKTNSVKISKFSQAYYLLIFIKYVAIYIVTVLSPNPTKIALTILQKIDNCIYKASRDVLNIWFY